jgi:hypothetical protein
LLAVLLCKSPAVVHGALQQQLRPCNRESSAAAVLLPTLVQGGTQPCLPGDAEADHQAAASMQNADLHVLQGLL